MSIIIGIVIINIIINKKINYGIIIIVGYYIYKYIKNMRIENKYMGYNTKIEKRIDNIGYYIIIITEMIMFITLIGIYIYVSIRPSIEINSKWEPVGIKKVEELGIPLINTIILISSGISITSGHLTRNKERKREWIERTIRITIIFIILQYIEYKNTSYDITTSIYGNIFYTITGFHGIHVIFSIIWIYKEYINIIKGEKESNKGIIYTHIVDIIWIFIYLILYIL